METENSRINKTHCTEKGSAEFSRKEFQDKYVSYLKEIYPTNNTVSSTIDRQMQVLRDDDIIEFVSPGVYKWLEFGAENLDENSGFRPMQLIQSPMSHFL